MRAISEKLNHETRKQSDRKVGYRQTPGGGFEFYGLRFTTGTAHEERREPIAEDVKRNLDAIAQSCSRSSPRAASSVAASSRSSVLPAAARARDRRNAVAVGSVILVPP